MSDSQGYVKEHRLVVAERLGRNLDHCEHVHHKDGDRKNNSPENLELWAHMHPSGQRVSDLVEFARRILALYDHC